MSVVGRGYKTWKGYQIYRRGQLGELEGNVEKIARVWYLGEGAARRWQIKGRNLGMGS